jgi:ParB/RepB/Spo0J family partition protein
MSAPKLATKHTAEKVGDTYLLDPRDVTLQEEDLRGRKFPPSKSDIKDLADSIMRHGQQEAVKCRLGEDGKPILVFGRTRYEAVTLINTELDPKNPRKLVAVIVDQDERGAFLSANEENRRRKATSAVDEAFNHQVMREKFGMKDVEIAKDCGVSAAMVSKLRKIISLPKEVLKQIHDGNITFSDAVTMADLDIEKQKQIAADAKETAEKVAAEKSAAAVDKVTGEAKPVKKGKRPAKEVSEGTRATVRAEKAKKAKKSGEEATAVTSRSVKEIRAFHEALAETYSSTEALVEFAKSVVKYCAGKISDKQLENAIIKLAQSGMKKAPEKAALVDWE